MVCSCVVVLFCFDTSQDYDGEGNGNPLQYSSWRILWTEEPGGLQSMGSQRVRHDWAHSTQDYDSVLVGASLVAQLVMNLPAMQETRVWSLGQEDPLEKIPFSRNRGTWRATVHGVAKGQTWLSDWTPHVPLDRLLYRVYTCSKLYQKRLMWPKPCDIVELVVLWGWSMAKCVWHSPKPRGPSIFGSVGQKLYGIEGQRKNLYWEPA